MENKQFLRLSNCNNYLNDLTSHNELSNTPHSKHRSKNCSDRFIPSRTHSNLQRVLFKDDDSEQ